MYDNHRLKCTVTLNFVGKSNTANVPLYAGQMSSLSIWRGALTTSQINAASSTVYTGSETGLIGYWPMNAVVNNQVVALGNNALNGNVTATKRNGHDAARS